MCYVIWLEEKKQTHYNIVIQINSDVILQRNILEGHGFRIDPTSVKNLSHLFGTWTHFEGKV